MRFWVNEKFKCLYFRGSNSFIMKISQQTNWCQNSAETMINRKLCTDSTAYDIFKGEHILIYLSIYKL